MEARRQDRFERGVWEPAYRSPGGRRWLHAIAADGKLVAWLEYGPDAGRTLDQAAERLWRALDRHDPVPQLRLVKPDPDEGVGRIVLSALANGWHPFPPV